MLVWIDLQQFKGAAWPLGGVAIMVKVWSGLLGGVNTLRVAWPASRCRISDAGDNRRNHQIAHPLHLAPENADHVQRSQCFEACRHMAMGQRASIDGNITLPLMAARIVSTRGGGILDRLVSNAAQTSFNTLRDIPEY